MKPDIQIKSTIKGNLFIVDGKKLKCFKKLPEAILVHWDEYWKQYLIHAYGRLEYCKAEQKKYLQIHNVDTMVIETKDL